MGTLATSDTFLFECFRFDRRGLFRREEHGGVTPLKIGSRAEDVLRVLVERAGELVSKDEIITRVWPGLVVEESNLTVQISTLRRCQSFRSNNDGSCRIAQDFISGLFTCFSKTLRFQSRRP